MRVGVLAGVNFSNVHSSNGTTSENGDSQTGFLGGVFTQYQFSDGFYFEPQLRYAQKGAGAVDLDYLELPLYAKYKFMTGNAFMPHVFVGPTVAYRIGASAGGVSNDAVSDSFKSFDLSIDAGIGAEFAATESMNLGISAAYQFGLLNILDGAAQTASPNTTSKNRGFNLYATASWAY